MGPGAFGPREAAGDPGALVLICVCVVGEERGGLLASAGTSV